MFPETATAEQLADLLGVDPETVRELARRGIATKRARGQFEVRATIRRYCDHLRAQAGRWGSGEYQADLTKERALLAREQRVGHEIKNAAARSELVSVQAVERQWADGLRRLRSAMLAISSRLRQRLPHLTITDVVTIDREIRGTLADLSRGGDGGGESVVEGLAGSDAAAAAEIIDVD